MKSKKETNKFSKELKLFSNAKVLAISALLSATGLILAFLAKSIFGSSPLRFTFENLPIFFAAFIFGPSVAGVTALCSDLISCFISGMVPIPLISVGSILIGVISGIIFKYILFKKSVKISVPIAVFTAHFIGSAIIKSLALYPIYGKIVFFRIPLYFATATIESTILILILMNKSFMNQIGKAINKK